MHPPQPRLTLLLYVFNQTASRRHMASRGDSVPIPYYSRDVREWLLTFPFPPVPIPIHAAVQLYITTVHYCTGVTLSLIHI